MVKIILNTIGVISLVAPITLLAGTTASGKDVTQSDLACEKSKQELVMKRFMDDDKSKELRNVRQLKTDLDPLYAKVQSIFKQYKGNRDISGKLVLFEVAIEPTGEISSLCVLVDKINDKALTNDLANLFKTVKFSSGDYRFQVIRYPASAN